MELNHAFRPFQLELKLELRQQWTVLFGPSGSGKTTILRAIAGLLLPDQGTIALQGKTTFSRSEKTCSTNMPAHVRGLGMVMQAPALFPHLTATQNMEFSLRGLPAEDRERRVIAMEEALGIHTFHDAYPRQLSIGQQQRVSLARTLIAEPRALLLDEPFSAMDRTSRQEVLQSLQQWVAERAIPILMVTHDLAEAFAASDEVVLLREGRAIAQGAAPEVLHAERLRLLHDLAAMPQSAQPSPDR